MLWSRLRLRTRILAGYGLMFILVAALVVLLTVRFRDLNTQIGDLSAHVAAEAAAGSQIAAQVAHSQQLVDRYLQQPTAANQQAAANALDQLGSQLQDAAATLDSPHQRDALAQLTSALAAYQQGFHALTTQIRAQQQTSGVLITQLSDATLALQKTTTSYLRTDGATPSALSLPQQHLELAILLSARLVNEQTATLGTQAASELSVARSSLLFQQDIFDATTNQLAQQAITSMQQASASITRYQHDLAQFQAQREDLLTTQGARVQAQAQAIATNAMEQLLATSRALERQSSEVQQWMLIGLVLLLGTAGLFGGILPATITRPLLQLVAATRTIQQGDLELTLATTDGSEIGQLTNAFRQLAAALHQERQAVQAQQAALAQQNQELTQTLGALQASIAARDQLAQTMRALSVPVVPILKQVILIPLVGEIDASRANILLERLLSTLMSAQARIAIIDITGVPLVDASLVGWLIKITLAARLMGARCTLVGISPEVAQALVTSGAPVDVLHVRADLRDAVEDAQRSSRRTATRTAL